MTLVRCILPDWAQEEHPELPKVKEGDFDNEKIQQLNAKFYNIYHYPNYPSHYTGGNVEGADVNVFSFVFVDMDLKDGVYKSKEDFIDELAGFPLEPTRVVDSGGGVHCYWHISDLTDKAYIRLQRRLAKLLRTDLAVGKLCQLMRLPGTLNTKSCDRMLPCEVLFEGDATYTMEQMDAVLPQLSMEDELYAKNHWDKTHGELATVTAINTKMPDKFKKLLRDSKEVREIWNGNRENRSIADFRLGHLLWSHGFSKEEALAVLVNCPKALARAPKHREAYASGIVAKITEYEETGAPQQEDWDENIADVLSSTEEVPKGERLECHPSLDNTKRGFRLGQVIGLVAGSGVGKTTVALNMFRWIALKNPNLVHFFVPLEQTTRELAERWQTVCGTDTQLHKKVHVLSNFAKDGTNRCLSLDDIEEYIVNFQLSKGKKVGVVVIDHIGALKRQDKNGTNEGLIDICHKMKSFAIRTNTLVIMQSQAPREKAGDGDLELSKSAAYGTVFFESFCDFLLTVWQPVKRLHHNLGCPTVMAYKFCKIRYKNRRADVIQEDVPYYMFFDTDSERLREMTQDEEAGFKVWDKKARDLRKQDRKTDEVTYTKITCGDKDESNTEDSADQRGSAAVTKLHQG